MAVGELTTEVGREIVLRFNKELIQYARARIVFTVAFTQLGVIGAV